MSRLVTGITFFCFAINVAHAQGGDAAARLAAREHYQKGSVAYELGHYDTAIAEYERAYQAFNEPTGSSIVGERAR